MNSRHQAQRAQVCDLRNHTSLCIAQRVPTRAATEQPRFRLTDVPFDVHDKVAKCLRTYGLLAPCTGAATVVVKSPQLVILNPGSMHRETQVTRPASGTPVLIDHRAHPHCLEPSPRLEFTLSRSDRSCPKNSSSKLTFDIRYREIPYGSGTRAVLTAAQGSLTPAYAARSSHLFTTVHQCSTFTSVQLLLSPSTALHRPPPDLIKIDLTHMHDGI